MIETLYIHAGLHKTGSSSIQRFLNTNRVQLMTHGIRVSRLKGIVEGNDTLSRSGVKAMTLEPLRRLDMERVIVSKEQFSWIQDINTLRKLNEELCDFAKKVTIIFYIRRQDSLAVSLKQQGVKSKSSAFVFGLDLGALPGANFPGSHSYLDFEGKLSMWAEVFGQENVVVRIFEPERLIDGDVVCDFCNIFAINPDDFELPKRINESFTRTSQLFLQQTTHQFKQNTHELNLLIEAVRRVDRKLENKEKLLPSRQQAKDFYQQFVDGNKRLNKRFNISSNESIFNDDFSMYPQTIDENELSERELHQMYAKVFTYLRLKGESIGRAGSIRLAHELRDIALALPEQCRQQTIGLLQEALMLHPKGKFIRKKLQEYEGLDE